GLIFAENQLDRSVLSLRLSHQKLITFSRLDAYSDLFSASSVADRGRSVPPRRLWTMSRRGFARVVVAVVILLVLVTLGLGFFLTTWNGDDEHPDKSKPAAQDGFQEEGPKAGITFRMSFLPQEQGAKFKANLYDHGCGVA